MVSKANAAFQWHVLCDVSCNVCWPHNCHSVILSPSQYLRRVTFDTWMVTDLFDRISTSNHRIRSVTSHSKWIRERKTKQPRALWWPTLFFLFNLTFVMKITLCDNEAWTHFSCVLHFYLIGRAVELGEKSANRTTKSSRFFFRVDTRLENPFSEIEVLHGSVTEIHKLYVAWMGWMSAHRSSRWNIQLPLLICPTMARAVFAG